MERKRSVRRRRRYEKTFAKKCKEYGRSFFAFIFSNVGIIGLVLSYTVAGAFIFRNIESDYDLQIKSNMLKNRKETVGIIWNVTLLMNTFDEDDYKIKLDEVLMDFQKKIVKFVRVDGYDGSRLEYSAQWSVAGSFLYSLTVITTIGYGNIYPHTVAGQVATIVYAIIGMPLFLLYLSNIGDVMARSFKWIYANLCLCRWCPGVAKRRAERRQRAQMYYDYTDEESRGSSNSIRDRVDDRRPNKFEQQRNSIVASEMSEAVTEGLSEGSYDVQAITVPVTVCLMIMVGYICGGALLFCKWEDWEFLEASYFCFISLSTIGFGDLVPGDKIVGQGGGEIFELSFIFCSMYLMVGMALIAMCFNLMQEEVINKIRTIIRTIKYVCRCHR